MKTDVVQKTFLKEEKGRKWIIEKVIEANIEDNWQKNHTPYDLICESMINKTTIKNKKILVLFNIEFIEVLINKYDKNISSNIYFVSDCELEKLIAQKIYKIKNVSVVKDINDIKNLYQAGDEIMEGKFDLCFSNPPYNRGVDLKIIEETLKKCNEMVVVHPSTWLIDLKNSNKPYTNFKNLIKNNVKSFDLFNGNPIFDVELFVPCVITHITEESQKSIKVKYFNKTFEVNSIYDVTRFHVYWFDIVKPFINKIQKYINTNMGHIWSRNIFKINKKKYHCQLAAIRGTPYRGDNIQANLELNDFFTLIMKNPEENKGIRQPNLKRPGNPTPTFEFDTENELNNFITYCQTFFVRFCLAIYKTNQNTSVGGTLNLIPWMNFKQKWDDEKLYKHFNIDKKTQEYIENFLPDFHGLRK